MVQAGRSRVGQLRLGSQDLSLPDRWLGKVADLLELIGNNAANSNAKAVAGWIEELLDARHFSDTVRMADLLEYEILPRLSL
jgi:hypothetical protein